MFTGLLEWILIIAAIVIIFNANNLSSWKEIARKKIETLKKAAAEKRLNSKTKSILPKIKKTKNNCQINVFHIQNRGILKNTAIFYIKIK